ncbi:MAG: carbamoyltransferase HypF, partial [Bacteroidota bacterium]
MTTWHLHIEGQVQGVGFRPFVYLQAQQRGLSGWVNNSTDGVHVRFNASADVAEDFRINLLREAPPLARISRHHMRAIANEFFDNFQIIHSHTAASTNLLISPDFALCTACREELYAPNDRRRHYAFITCTHCGPRYSILQQLPYDRPQTTMESFDMCPTCQQEYDDPHHRRYYSQTNSCPSCPIELALYDAQQQVMPGSQAQLLDQVVEDWRAGKIIALKGIGGYLLTCDAQNSASIQRLRRAKHRPSKAFALMFPHLEAIQKIAVTCKAEIQLLQSPAAPIVLLETKPESNSELAIEQIAPGLNRLGIVLPYTPLFDLLLRRFDGPIVATSGNISQSPIIYRNDVALKQLGQIADRILINNRDIVVPQDDSVIQLSPVKKQIQFFRRSRGFAPTFFSTDTWPSGNILATGAMLKSTFCLLHQGQPYVSQYLGNLEHFDVQQNYQHLIQHFFALLDTTPEAILSDLHPQYPSSQYGLELAQ